jgi:hypothetical protein
VAAGAWQQHRASGGKSAWVAWSLCVLSLTLTALSLVLLTLTLFHPGVPTNYYWLETTIIAASYSTVGAIVAPASARAPKGGCSAR